MLTISFNVQQGPIAAPLVSEVAIPEPEVEMEVPAKHDLASSPEESPVTLTEPETSYVIEVTPTAIDHGLSESAPILTAAEQLPEVASREILQPQSTAVPDNSETQVEIITSSPKLEGLGTAENIEAESKEVSLSCFS